LGTLQEIVFVSHLLKVNLYHRVFSLVFEGERKHGLIASIRWVAPHKLVYITQVKGVVT